MPLDAAVTQPVPPPLHRKAIPLTRALDSCTSHHKQKNCCNVKLSQRSHFANDFACDCGQRLHMWSAACTASAGRTETKAPDAEGNLTACRTRADNFAIESSGLPSASFADPLAQGAAVKTAAPVEFIERDGFAFVASDAEVQFRAKSAKTQQTMLNKCDASSDISPSAAAAPIDADTTVSFAAFAPNAKPPAFQDAKNSSRSACADLQAATPYTPPKPNLT